MTYKQAILQMLRHGPKTSSEMKEAIKPLCTKFALGAFYDALDELESQCLIRKDGNYYVYNC